MLQFHSVEFEFKKILVFFSQFWCHFFNHICGLGLNALWSPCLGLSWCHLAHNSVTTTTSDPLTFATFGPRDAARLLFFPRPCVLLHPPRVSSLLSKCFQQNLAAPFSSFLPPLPFLKKKLFFSLPTGKIIIIIKTSQIILPRAVTVAALSTPSHFSVSPVATKKKNAVPRGSGGNIYQILSASRFIPSCFPLLSCVCFSSSSLPLHCIHFPSSLPLCFLIISISLVLQSSLFG